MLTDPQFQCGLPKPIVCKAIKGSVLLVLFVSKVVFVGSKKSPSERLLREAASSGVEETGRADDNAVATERGQIIRSISAIVITRLRRECLITMGARFNKKEVMLSNK